MKWEVQLQCQGAPLRRFPLVFSQREGNKTLVRGVNFLHSQGSGASERWWHVTPTVEHFIPNQSFLLILLGLVIKHFMSSPLRETTILKPFRCYDYEYFHWWRSQ